MWTFGRGSKANDADAVGAGVDEMNLFIFPVVVGQGTRLFPATGPDVALEVVDSRVTPKGITIQVYRPAGRPRYSVRAPSDRLSRT